MTGQATTHPPDSMRQQRRHETGVSTRSYGLNIVALTPVIRGHPIRGPVDAGTRTESVPNACSTGRAHRTDRTGRADWDQYDARRDSGGGVRSIEGAAKRAPQSTRVARGQAPRPVRAIAGPDGRWGGPKGARGPYCRYRPAHHAGRQADR